MSTQQLERIDWLKHRRNSIGASEAAAVLGLHPYISPLSLWESKVTDAEPDNEETEIQRRGHIFEEPIAQMYANLTGRTVKPSPGTERHPKYSFLTATKDRIVMATVEQLDGLVSGEGLLSGPLELKSIIHFKQGDDLPVHFQVQIQQQMDCDAERPEFGSFALLGPFYAIIPVDVRRNDPFIELLNERCHEFWERYVLTGTPPPVDGHPATTEALKRLFPRDAGTRVDLAGEFPEMATRLEDTKLQIKNLEADERDLENKIRAAMGEATYAVLPDMTGFSLKTTRVEGYSKTVKSFEYRKLHRIKKFKKGIL